MKRTLRSDGVYQDARGFFWIRPVLNGRRTWRKLASLTLQDARGESGAMRSDHARARLGLCTDPFNPPPPTVADAARSVGRTLPGPVLAAFGSRSLGDLNLPDATAWARARGATRAADIELSALGALCSEAVRQGWIRQNPLAGRARMHHTKRHSREVMPADGDHLHALARALLAEPRSRGIGWQLLLAALTGCRTNELLALRMDAAGRNSPGWIEGRYLYVRRAKGGMFPFVELTPELQDCIAAHHEWHRTEGGGSPWWFPGADFFRPLGRTALTQALARLDGPKVTAHGLRAYCVTVWRCRGESNERVAARIGDRTSALIETTYGALPESWSGGEPLGWLPRTGAPAWENWIPVVPQNIIKIA